MNESSKSEGQRLQELRRSNASGIMADKRTKRSRDRSTKERKAREDQE